MRKNHKACVALTGIGAGALLALGAPGAAEAQGLWNPSLMAIVGSSPGQNIVNSSSSSANSSSSSSTQLKIEGSSQQEKSQGLGPYVTSTNLSETSYQDYGLYMESINNDAFFYASVSNGGMTDQPVYLDFPQNLEYALEKDGVEQVYNNKTYLSESGSYVFHIYVVKDKSKPLSEQTISEATFHFRIQQKLPGAGQSSSGGSSSSSASSTLPSTPYLDSSSVYSSSQNISNALNSVTDAVNAANGAATSIGSAANSVSSAADNISQSAENAADNVGGLLDIGLSDAEVPEETTEEENTETELVLPETESTDSDNALRTLLGINVPNGMLSNTSVTFDPDNVAAMGATVSVLKDGEAYDVPADGSFNEVGSYTMLIREKDSVKPVTYSFKLIGDVSADMGLYTVPEGLTVDSLTIDGATQSLGILSAETGVPQIDFSKEGNYDLVLRAEDGYTYHFTVQIDNTAPTCYVTTKTNRADFNYVSQDIDHVVLTKDGVDEGVYNGTELNYVTESGHYTARIYDAAGNVTTLTFRVRRGLNLAAIIAVLLVIGLGATGVIFVRRIRENGGIK